MRIQDKKGFTLVEVLVVIAIIGILAVIATPMMFKYIDKAKISEFKNDIRSFEFAIDAFYIKHDKIPQNHKEWCEAVSDNIDGNYKIVDDEVDFNSPFDSKYIFYFIKEQGEDTVPVYRIDIGGFVVSKSVVKYMKEDEYFDNGNISIMENGTVWVGIEIPK